jgi:hypothetical protein
MAESVAPATDPLNLMRVMPPKGARVRCRTGISAMRETAHGFLFNDKWTRIDTNDFRNRYSRAA